MAQSDFERRAALLSELVVELEETQPNLNESTTRTRIIDVLLFDALGWPRNQCTTEEPLDGTYTDYSLGAPATQLIVEAKRVGTYFALPSTTGPLVVRLKSLTTGNQELQSAISQAKAYCADRGVRLAVVTNGHQLVAFLGSRDDGTPPLSGRAVVFRSLREMEDRFIDLWNWLSVEGVAIGNLFTLLKTEAKPSPPEKLSQRLWVYPGEKKRNALQIELDILGELFLQDIMRAQEIEEEFLRECYCSSGTLSQYALVSKDILRSRYHETVNRNRQQVLSVTSKKGVSAELIDAVVQEGISRRPIVLLGDVGVGKTTFIRRLVRIDAREELAGSIVFYIDFGSKPALRRDLELFVVETFAEQLFEIGLDIYGDEFVRAVYNGNLNRLGAGIFGRLKTIDPNRYFEEELKLLAGLIGQRESHLRSALQHMRGTEGKNVVVFFDNIDQRDVEFQDAVYLIAQSLSESRNLTTFVSLRPQTFNASKKSGSLTAYQPRVFTISPPRIDQVIKKRLSFASSAVEAGRLALTAEGITLDSVILRDYINVLIYSLNKNPDLCECIDNVSGGNVRRALGLLTSFVGSGHVDTTKILSIWRESGSYTIPLHEFLRAIIYGGAEHFDPSSSPIVNAFDISSPNPREHFSMPLILNFLHRNSQHGAVEYGFVLLGAVYDHCQSFGFSVEEIDFALGRAVAGELAESSVGAASDRPHGAERIRLTQSGAYLLHRLMGMFVYYDAVVVDTPIVSDRIRPQIGEARQIGDRLDRAEIFVTYLECEFDGLRGLPTEFDFPTQVALVREDIASIRRRLDRATERNRVENASFTRFTR